MMVFDVHEPMDNKKNEDKYKNSQNDTAVSRTHKFKIWVSANIVAIYGELSFKTKQSHDLVLLWLFFIVSCGVFSSMLIDNSKDALSHIFATFSLP